MLALAVVQVAPLAGVFTSVTVLLFSEKKSLDHQSHDSGTVPFSMAGYFHCAPLAALCRVTRGRHIGVKIEKLRLFCSSAEVLKNFTRSEKLAFFPRSRALSSREREAAPLCTSSLFSASHLNTSPTFGCGKLENKQADDVEAATGRK